MPTTGDRITLGNRALELRLSPRASAALAAPGAPLAIEMELYFSCLLRKRVYFRAEARADVAAQARLNERVTVSFRPVMTKACAVNATAGAPELEAFPLQRVAAFTPHWLALDYHAGRWTGDFGFAD